MEFTNIQETQQDKVIKRKSKTWRKLFSSWIKFPASNLKLKRKQKYMPIAPKLEVGSEANINRQVKEAMKAYVASRDKGERAKLAQAKLAENELQQEMDRLIFKKNEKRKLRRAEYRRSVQNRKKQKLKELEREHYWLPWSAKEIKDLNMILHRYGYPTKNSPKHHWDRCYQCCPEKSYTDVRRQVRQLAQKVKRLEIPDMDKVYIPKPAIDYRTYRNRDHLIRK